MQRRARWRIRSDLGKYPSRTWNAERVRPLMTLLTFTALVLWLVVLPVELAQAVLG
jgi:hypothetical protein